MVLWRPSRPFRTNPQKRCPFHYRGLECKSRKSRNTWNNRQICPWSTKWSREKANRVLPREHTGHSKHPLPTTQEKILHMDITRWSTVGGQREVLRPWQRSWGRRLDTCKGGIEPQKSPWKSLSIYPHNQSLPTLLLCAPTYTSDFKGGCPPPPLSEKDLT